MSNGIRIASMKKLRIATIAVIVVVVVIIGTTAWLITRSISNPSEHPSGYTEHTTIYIGGDSDFIPDNGVVEGNGTVSDPYIIAGWYIETSILWDGRMAGIQIMNANVYFIVRDCYISERASNRDWGIYLSNCVNGTLENNNCSYNEYGIYLGSSSNITICNNSCFSNRIGICISGSCPNNVLINNTCAGCGYGISLSSSGNTLINNTCISNLDCGICLEYKSYRNTMRSNTCSLNGGSGMRLYASSDNTVSDNTCSSNVDCGISFVWSCNGSYVSGNICDLNGKDGMSLYSSSYNTLTDNCFSSNNNSGISLIRMNSNNPCIGNEITGNEFYNNDEYAIRISSGSDNLICGNAILDNNGATDTYNASRAQAYDNSGSNSWYASGETLARGNYWSDLTAPDINGDEFVDGPYILAGDAGAEDGYPLTFNPLNV